VTNFVPEAASQRSFSQRLIPVDARERCDAMTVDNFGCVGVSKLSAVENVCWIFVDRSWLIEGRVATIWRGSAGEHHEEESVFTLPGLSEDFRKDGIEQGRSCIAV
jgi:hypothetical protein